MGIWQGLGFGSPSIPSMTNLVLGTGVSIWQCVSWNSCLDTIKGWLDERFMKKQGAISFLELPVDDKKY